MLVKLRFDRIWNNHNKLKNYRKIEKPMYIVFICHILTTQVEKHGLHTFKIRKTCISCDIAKLKRWGLSLREKWFWNCNMKFSKTSQKLHFGVTKKDPGLLFHFHVLNLFRFDQDSNGHKNSKKNQKEKNQST